jgi:hypothetical protein
MEASGIARFCARGCVITGSTRGSKGAIKGTRRFSRSRPNARYAPPAQTATRSKGVTHFGRVMFELNIDGLCANSSQAKGRVERANLTLQDRLVKELRLRHIDTREAANAYAPHFIADYNTRFGKVPRSAFNAHRPLRADENLDTILTWREPRRVTRSLTLQYDRVIYLLDDTETNRRLVGRYIDVDESGRAYRDPRRWRRPSLHAL